MRVVVFDGKPVKKQRATKDGLIRVSFYDGSAQDVTAADWRAKAENRFFADGTNRSDIVRNMSASRSF